MGYWLGQARHESGEEKRRGGDVWSEAGSKGSDSPRRGRRRGGEEASSTSSHEERKPSRDSACDSPDPHAVAGAKEQRGDGERQQRLDSASPARDADAARPVKVRLPPALQCSCAAYCSLRFCDVNGRAAAYVQGGWSG